jgi:hypothetical protein
VESTRLTWSDETSLNPTVNASFFIAQVTVDAIASPVLIDVLKEVIIISSMALDMSINHNSTRWRDDVHRESLSTMTYTDVGAIGAIRAVTSMLDHAPTEMTPRCASLGSALDPTLGATLLSTLHSTLGTSLCASFCASLAPNWAPLRRDRASTALIDRFSSRGRTRLDDTTSCFRSARST